MTTNISASGVFFETDKHFTPGSEITFLIELSGPQDEKLLLRFRGVIIRLEKRNGGIGVAVKSLASKLHSENRRKVKTPI
jgi:hypothetical protein